VVIFGGGLIYRRKNCFIGEIYLFIGEFTKFIGEILILSATRQ
jgi:hypothetical protein